jgi:non-heme chloroperoxidase
MALKTVKIDNKTFEISYNLYNYNKTKSIIFLHGWGSNKEIMEQAFKNDLNEFKLLFIDMPGFGKSNTKEILRTIDYKNILEEFLNQINIKKDVIVGHSFGGKVATLLNPENLVLLSTAGIVEEKSFKVKFKIKLFKLLKSVFGDKMYKLFATKDVDNMPKNMYETLKNVVDEDFTNYFKEYKNNSLIFWGIDDKAVNLKSGELISQLIEKNEFYPMNGDHYFFLNNKDDIKNIMKEKLYIENES